MTKEEKESLQKQLETLEASMSEYEKKFKACWSTVTEIKQKLKIESAKELDKYLHKWIKYSFIDSYYISPNQVFYFYVDRIEHSWNEHPDCYGFTLNDNRVFHSQCQHLDGTDKKIELADIEEVKKEFNRISNLQTQRFNQMLNGEQMTKPTEVRVWHHTDSDMEHSEDSFDSAYSKQPFNNEDEE